MMYKNRKIIFLVFCLWSFLVLFSYYKYHCVLGTGDNFVLDEIILSLFIFVVSFGIGCKILKIFKVELSPEYNFFYSIGLGLGVLSYLVLGIGLLGGLYKWLIWILILTLFLITVREIKDLLFILKRIYVYFLNFKSKSYLFLFFMFILFSVLIFLMTLIPPISRDALIHHLAIPKIYIQNHKIIEIPFSVVSYYPMNLEMLYLVGMILNSDILAKLIHFMFGLLTCGVIYSYLKNKFSKTYALLGSLIFLTIPMVILLSSQAYVDLGLAFYTLLAIAALLEWRKSNFQKHWFVLSAVCCGLAIGTKYNGLLIFMFLWFGVIYLPHRKEINVSKVIRLSIAYFLLVLMISSPWLVKNIAYRGNPVFPLFNSFFEKDVTQIEDARISGLESRCLLYGETWKDYLFLPWTMSIKGQDGNPKYFDGVLNPIFLIFLPFLLFLPRMKSDLRLMGLFSLLYFLFTCFLTGLRIRYLLPIFPLLCIITVSVIYFLYKDSNKLYKATIIFTLFVLLFFNFYYTLERFEKLNPLSFVLGKETREEFLLKHSLYYDVFKFINENLPDKAKIWFLYIGDRGYYCNRNYFYDSYYSGGRIKNIIKTAKNTNEILDMVKKMEISHFLINPQLFFYDLENSLSEKKVSLFNDFALKCFRRIYSNDKIILYELNTNG